MARVFVSHSSVDQAFALRLAEDLRGEGARVWLDEWELRAGDRLGEHIERGIATHDYFLVLFSRASLASEWVQRELAWAYKREQSNLGVRVLPIRIDDSPLPDIVHDRKCADFESDYETGLALILDTLRHARVKTLLTLPNRRVITARRGVPTRQGTRHPIGVLALGGQHGCLVAVIEAIGDPEHGPELTATVGKVIDTVLRKQLTEGKALTPDDLPSYLKLACSAGVYHKVHEELPLEHPVGARMSLAVQMKDRVFVATIGECSVVAHTANPDGTFLVSRFKSNNEVRLPAVDLGGLGFIAPIGFVQETGELKLDVTSFPLERTGDLVAPLSFPVVRTESEFRELAEDVVRAATPEQAVSTLAESHQPSIVDTLSAALVIDPDATTIAAGQT